MASLAQLGGAIAALGAALIALAVGAAAPLWLAVPLLAAGVGQAIVSVLALRGAKLAVAAVAAPLLLPTLAWLATLLLVRDPAASLPLGPMLAESALALTAAGLLARRSRATRAPAPIASLLVLVGAAVVVAPVATIALTGTHAGAFAQPHGEHGVVLDVDEHVGH
ncbi:hypothetical protein [Agrococcus sp. Marseille-Q4369]|uniref:hypothetical protein n=1 Tax=Agrococcus sp. Marseille-Q4369 TaxID=2810513 RepID=UPI001B8BB54C|nr:hypothetical protein [Agrococcus sp. Marseille-Q4369]QUW19008.1 hypothetical protein JSQ78_01125 [Agrococcus sp. Marseille-Q4369]